MERYRIEFARSVRRDLRKINKRDVLRILKAIEKLEVDPRPPNCKKLTRSELYRIRVGRYRVVYEVFDETVVVMISKIGDRKDVYR